MGLETLAALKKIDREVPDHHFFGAGTNHDQVVQAMQLGAADYLNKPFEDEELEATLRPALGAAARAGAQPLLDELEEWHARGRLGQRRDARRARAGRADLRHRRHRARPGESGIGKELVARAI